ncbi:chitinase [Plakobranchus ocellatus]|uniref:Chitinase n=1 Tax=Plakobranchus ocellatus TaxID=259542 RepID=A0AAV4BV69_9GAST|nr:chitinase [Plakobranchus ocellatus]
MSSSRCSNNSSSRYDTATTAAADIAATAAADMTQQQQQQHQSTTPSGQGTGGRARARDRRVPADLRANSLASVPPTPHNLIKYIGCFQSVLRKAPVELKSCDDIGYFCYDSLFTEIERVLKYRGNQFVCPLVGATTMVIKGVSLLVFTSLLTASSGGHAQHIFKEGRTGPFAEDKRDRHSSGEHTDKSHILRVVPEASDARTAVCPRLQGGQACPRVVCYYTNWAQYRPGQGKYTPDSAKISAPLCTHIHYAFAKIENGELAPYEWNDPDHDGHEGNFRLITDLKRRNPGLKVLLSVGGWNMNSQPFSQMVRTAESRKKFILSAKSLLQKYNFDGLDIDWEYPTQRDAPVPEDKHRFTLLLQETMEVFKKVNKSRTTRFKGREADDDDGLLVAAALAAGQKVLNASYEWTEIHKYLDYAILMSYDFHGSWDNVTGENSPLFNAPDDPGMSVSAAAKLWIALGFPPEKLLVGVASYGRSFTLTSSTSSGLGAPVTSPGSAQQFTRLAGMASYYEVCRIIQDGGAVTQLTLQDVPYVVKGNLWIGYDDEKSFKDKVKFVQKNGLGGVALWTLDLDDFSGDFCGAGQHPLLRALSFAETG